LCDYGRYIGADSQTHAHLLSFWKCTSTLLPLLGEVPKAKGYRLKSDGRLKSTLHVLGVRKRDILPKKEQDKIVPFFCFFITKTNGTFFVNKTMLRLSDNKISLSYSSGIKSFIPETVFEYIYIIF